MKKIIILLSGALIILTSCGISASYTSSGGGQKFTDGIYTYSPSRKDKKAEQDSKAELQALAEQTKASQIYLFGDRKDTVMIPENMAATIRYDKNLGTSVTVMGFDPYDFTTGWYADRYRWNNAYWHFGGYYNRYYSGWYDPWYYGSLYSPWYYGSFHSPWYYGGYYDPWYYGGWYDPWYYGFGYRGWYDPFYGYMHPHYCGWYGGWDPYHHHHHHVSYPSSGAIQHREVYRGSRLETSGNRVLAGGSSSRPSSGNVTRRVSTTSRNSFGTSRTSSVREATGRRPAVSSQSSSRSAATYRRPAGTSSRVSGSSSAPYSRSSSTTGSSSTYSRNSSSSNNSSTYSRSYSSPGRSSYSSGSSGGGGGYSRSSSSGGGGGYSRSSSGGRR